MGVNAGVRSRAERPVTSLWRSRVRRTELITPRMVRITVGEESLVGFPSTGGDQHVMLYLYPPGVELPSGLTVESARKLRPWMRSYTIRRHDRDAAELAIDFVLHGGHGPATAWAGAARPGDELIFVGPSPRSRLSLDAQDYLFIGDETALPAIAALLEDLPPTARARVVGEVIDMAERQDFISAAAVDVSWVKRAELPVGDACPLVDVLRTLELPEGLKIWAAGERSAMAAVRRHLVDERGLDRSAVRPATYWRRG